MKQPDVSLRADESVSVGFARVAGEVINRAVNRIRHPTSDRDEDLHTVRTAMKRLRGTLRLVRPMISDTYFNRECAHLRRSACRLAFSRDITVARKALASLAKLHSNRRQRSAVAAALAGLEKRTKPKTEVKTAMNKAARDLEQTGQRIQQLQLGRCGWEAIELGLMNVYRQGRKRMKAAFANGDDQSFHKWRMRLKDLYYELQMLEPIWPKRLNKMVSRLDDLQGNIGDSHDLVVLKTLLQRNTAAFGGTDTVRRVEQCLNRKSRKLRRAGQPLGKQVFAEKPRGFVRKLGKHWDRRKIQK
jgi:CHAD domain-containing protein